MPYVERSDGVVIGTYYGPLEGVAEEFLADDDREVVAFLDPPQSGTYSIFKTTLWLRLTDEEAETVMAAKNQQPAKFRGIWDDALSIQSDSQFFVTLKAFLTATLSVSRAGELLQPDS